MNLTQLMQCSIFSQPYHLEWGRCDTLLDGTSSNWSKWVEQSSRKWVPGIAQKTGTIQIYLLSLGPTGQRCLCQSVIQDSKGERLTWKKQKIILQFFHLSLLVPQFKDDLTIAFISQCNCYRFIILFYQETFILRKKVILMYQITYPRTNESSMWRGSC